MRYSLLVCSILLLIRFPLLVCCTCIALVWDTTVCWCSQRSSWTVSEFRLILIHRLHAPFLIIPSLTFFSWRYDTAWHINVGGLISRLQFKVLVHHWSSFCSWISTETAHCASIYELSFPCNLLAYMNWVLLLGRRARAHLRQAFIWMLFYLFLSWFISCNRARSRPGCDSIYFFFSTYLNLNPNWNGETLLAFDVGSTVGPTYRCH